MLQSMLIGDNNRVLERFQFADIEIGGSIDQASLDPSELEAHRVSSKVSTCLNNVESSVAQSNWQQSWLPPGFGLAGYLKSDDSGRETLIYTDGLAIFLYLSIVARPSTFLKCKPSGAQPWLISPKPKSGNRIF